MSFSAARTNRPYKFGAHDRREFIVQDSEVSLRLENDGAGNPIYIGRAKVGSSVADDKWQIQKLHYDVNGFVDEVLWPENSDGRASSEYEFIWNDRAAQTYV